MKTPTEKIARRAGRQCLIALGVIALLSATGCEYLGLGSGTSSDQKQKQKNKKAKSGDSDKKAKKAKNNKKGTKAAKKKPTKKPKKKEQPPALSKGDLNKKKEARRNPFASGIDVEKEESPTEEKESKESLGPLERHSYSKYRLAGIISQVAVPKAMFIAPDKVGYLLKEGDKLGNEGGRIEDVRDNAVALELPPEGENGKPRSATIKLRESELPDQDDEGMSEEEKKTLQQLLQSEEGRKAVRESYKKTAPGAEASDGDRQRRRRTSGSDSQFPGLEPPSE